MRKFLFGSRRRTIISAVAVVALIVVSIAAAAWLVTSQGSGRGAAGTLIAPSVTPAATAPTPGCTPGGTCAIGLHIENPNGPLVLTGTALGSSGDNTSSNPACNPNNLQVRTLTGLSIAVPAGASDVTVPDGFQLVANAPNDCAGATFTKPVQADFATP